MKKYIIFFAVIIILGGLSGAASYWYIQNRNDTMIQAPVIRPETARVDIFTEPIPKKASFSVYLDDNSEALPYTKWMTKLGRQGVMIQKDGNEATIKIEVTQDCQISLRFIGPDVRDANKKSIPIWVTYTSITLDDQQILKKDIDAWHNKPFKYKFDAKAGKTYLLHLNWQRKI